jgi:hypothetical protein
MFTSTIRAEVITKGVPVILTKSANTCDQKRPQRICSSSVLINAQVLVRKVYSSTVRLANTNKQGTLSIRLKPGWYEIALHEEYAYGDLNRSFGMSPCNRNRSTNGGFSCAEQSSCYPLSSVSSSYPPRYKESQDYPLNSFTNSEASTFIKVTNATKKIAIRYHLRCI